MCNNSDNNNSNNNSSNSKSNRNDSTNSSNKRSVGSCYSRRKFSTADVPLNQRTTSSTPSKPASK